MAFSIPWTSLPIASAILTQHQHRFHRFKRLSRARRRVRREGPRRWRIPDGAMDQNEVLFVAEVVCRVGEHVSWLDLLGFWIHKETKEGKIPLTVWRNGTKRKRFLLIAHFLGREMYMGRNWQIIYSSRSSGAAVHRPHNQGFVELAPPPHAYGDIYGVHVRSRRVLPSFQVRNREKKKKGKAALAARNREIDFLHAGVTESDKSRISWWTGMMAQETICIWFSALTQ